MKVTIEVPEVPIYCRGDDRRKESDNAVAFGDECVNGDCIVVFSPNWSTTYVPHRLKNGRVILRQDRIERCYR